MEPNYVHEAQLSDAIDAYLAPFGTVLGPAFNGYRNHAQRMARFSLMLGAAPTVGAVNLLARAAAYHDIGIWIEGTWDYLPPSRWIARSRSPLSNDAEACRCVDLMILEHHKLRAYRGPHATIVEAFRRGDLVDFSWGMIRFGLPKAEIRRVQHEFPNRGFHRDLGVTAFRAIARRPWKPLPMVRL